MLRFANPPHHPTFLWRVNNFCTIRSGIDPAGDGRRWRLKKLFLHVGLFDKFTRSPQQHNTVEHLQGDHPAHKHTKIKKLGDRIIGKLE